MRVCKGVIVGGMLAGLAWLAPAGAATIGVLLPASWPSRLQAEELQNGMTLALKTWPGDATPTLLIKDSACDPAKAAALTKELVAAKVDVVVGNWCEISSGAELLRQAGIAFISANAERVKGQELQLQLGRLDLYLADRLADQLRKDTGLRISARTGCWMSYEVTLSERYDAVLCPVLAVDPQRWQLAEGTYTAAFRSPFTLAAARGYAAMEVALAYLRRLKSGSRPAAALRETRSISTLLGPLPDGETAAPAQSLQLVFGPQLPVLQPKQLPVLEQLIRAKGCAARPAAADPWADQPFVVRGAGQAACPRALRTLAL